MTREEKVTKLKEKIKNEIKTWVKHNNTLDINEKTFYQPETFYQIAEPLIVRSLYDYLNNDWSFREYYKQNADGTTVYVLEERMIDRFLSDDFNFLLHFIFRCTEDNAPLFLGDCMNDRFINFEVMGVIESILIDKKLNKEVNE